MVIKSISIENDLFNYFNHNTIQYDILNKIELVWFDITTKKSYYF